MVPPDEPYKSLDSWHGRLELIERGSANFKGAWGTKFTEHVRGFVQRMKALLNQSETQVNNGLKVLHQNI